MIPARLYSSSYSYWALFIPIPVLCQYPTYSSICFEILKEEKQLKLSCGGLKGGWLGRNLQLYERNHGKPTYLTVYGVIVLRHPSINHCVDDYVIVYCTSVQHYRIHRTEPSSEGKSLKDEQTLNSLGLRSGSKLYFKDLGPQVGWSTVFLTEYFGPLVIYLIFYARPSIIYGADAADQPRDIAVHIAAACWTFHYAKRLLETIFVHRFSHATMPIMNIFKNSSYYWGFAAFVAYFINHPLYTPPQFGNAQLYGGLAGFLFAEYGNWRIHMAFRNLRTPGTKERRIPNATGDPMTILFNLVTCPNYTYETIAWVSFSVMTQCLPALMFGVCGFVQMAIWRKESTAIT
ncbi:putative very-long-chain enoyl-CoA reductase [Apostichopus japonicus]|uniref:Putative very-long-chain enoyl-CoA reductase n=1 Tax=Stichopus japonicus TaxID=307972 RepID=A0A2G8K537_STIJA|nr:putative very-long-chain enoyl-CoA reductase [Apostichopus japonicus]